MSVTIRPVAAADEKIWRTLWQSYNDFYERTVPDATIATTFSRFLDPNVQMYCAVAATTSPTSSTCPSAAAPTTTGANGEEILGFVTWFPHPSTSRIGPVVYLNDLFVDPSTRSQGVGGKLMDHVYEHAEKELGAESVYWLTQHFNHRAQLLYVKKGKKSDFVHYMKSLTE